MTRFDDKLIIRIILIVVQGILIMYICICNAVTEGQIREARDNGASSIEDLAQQLRVATCCGRCAECAQSILSESAEQAA